MIHRGTNAFWVKIGCGTVWTLFWSLEVGRGRQNAIRSQNYEVPKAYLPKLSKLSFAAHITSPHNPLEEVICVGKLNSEDFGSGIYLQHRNVGDFFLNRVNFGRP